MDTATLTVTVNGTNDAPTITGGDFAGSVTELPDGNPNAGTAVHTDSGAVTFSDVDVSNTHSASFTPQGAFYLGTFSLDPVDQPGDSVGWDFTVSDAALEGLSEGRFRVRPIRPDLHARRTDSQNVIITNTVAGAGVAPGRPVFDTRGRSTNVGPMPSLHLERAFSQAGTLGDRSRQYRRPARRNRHLHLRRGDGINLLDGRSLSRRTGPFRRPLSRRGRRIDSP